MWDPSSLTRDRTHTTCIGRLSLTHWATKEVPLYHYRLEVSYSGYTSKD